MTDKSTDAVAQAREAIRDTLTEGNIKGAWADDLLDALIAAVRAECAAKVWGFADAYPTDVWPEAEFSDAQAASVMRLMMPRILAALEAP